MSAMRLLGGVMTEIITHSHSGRELLEAYGCEVLTRCKDCKHVMAQDGYCSVLEKYIDPENYCSWGKPKP